MSLRKQAASLAAMHAADVLQPLLVLPYAARVLGPQQFGEFAYAMSIGQVAATIVEYGFHWTAQRAAASARRDPDIIAALFADVVATKSMLCLMVMLVGSAAAGGVLALSRSMFLCTMLSAVGGVLFPAWLLIGIERAWQASLAVVTARTLGLIAFFLMVRSPAQVEVAVGIQSAIPLVSGLVSLPFVESAAFSRLRFVTPSRVGHQLRNGWRGFLFTFVERASMILPVPLVQHFSGYVAAGQYSVAEKFVSATRPLLRVLSDTFLPRVAYYAQHDPAAGIRLIRRALATSVVGTGLSLGLYFVAPCIIVPLFGASFAGAIPLVRTMSIIPLILNINICTSDLYMFNYGHERAWSFLSLAGLLAFLTCAYVLGHWLSYGAIAVAIATIAKETLVLAVSLGFFLRSCAAGKYADRPRDAPRARAMATGFARLAALRIARARRNQASL